MATLMRVQEDGEREQFVLTIDKPEAWVILGSMVFWLKTPQRGPMTDALARDLVALLRAEIAGPGSDLEPMLRSMENSTLEDWTK